MSSLNFKDVYGHSDIIEYVAAAAGNHNFLMVGAPGCGKSMIAKKMPTILPPMTEVEVLETTSIYSICGLLKDSGRITSRPFRSPHYNASSNALIGGRMNAMLGERSYEKFQFSARTHNKIIKISKTFADI